MSFKIGDRVKLTGSGWPEVATFELPSRGSVVEIEEVHLPDSAYPKYKVSGYEHKLYLDKAPVHSWGVELIRNSFPTAAPTARAEALTKAADLIGGDRQDTYGSPAESFGRIAKLWSALLRHDVSASQVAMMLAAMKLSRLTGQNDHADSWIDLAGYAGLGYEISRGE